MGMHAVSFYFKNASLLPGSGSALTISLSRRTNCLGCGILSVRTYVISTQTSVRWYLGQQGQQLPQGLAGGRIIV